MSLTYRSVNKVPLFLRLFSINKDDVNFIIYDFTSYNLLTNLRITIINILFTHGNPISSYKILSFIKDITIVLFVFSSVMYLRIYFITLFTFTITKNH